MTRPTIVAALAVVALAIFAAQASAVVEPEPDVGVIVSAEEGKLVMTDPDGQNEREHVLGEDVTITLDGEEAKLADLKKDFPVRVFATQSSDGKMSIRIEALSKTK